MELFEDHVEDDTAELRDQVDESLHEVLEDVEGVVQDELLLLEVVIVECGVVVVTEVHVAVPEPVPQDACPGGP